MKVTITSHLNRIILFIKNRIVNFRAQVKYYIYTLTITVIHNILKKKVKAQNNVKRECKNNNNLVKMCSQNN